MKADVQRREKAQATVIENQAKRLDELETLYKVPRPFLDPRSDLCSARSGTHLNILRTLESLQSNRMSGQRWRA